MLTILFGRFILILTSKYWRDWECVKQLTL
nr:MAG TPA: hypothetical protein [Caudoviricetes sp.]